MLNEINHSFFIPMDQSFFLEHGKHFSAQQLKKNSSFPFKNHPQFPLIADILIRKYTHHAILHVNFSSHSHILFLEAFLQYLLNERTSYQLHQAELIYLDLNNLNSSKAKQKTIEKDVETLCASLDAADKNLLIAISNTSLFTKKKKKAEELFLKKQLEKLLHHPKCRFVILTNSAYYAVPEALCAQFSKVQITNPTDLDLLTLLKQERNELETFHHVLIPEETLSLAYAMASRFLSGTLALEQAILLLDSSAARIKSADKNDHPTNKPILTSNHLLQVLSDWTQIPTSHLQTTKFKFSEFLHAMQQHIFGQEAALTLIGQGLQLANIQFQRDVAPFDHFLFIGPKHTGKKTTALALTEYLFKQLHMFYVADLSQIASLSSFMEIKLQRHIDKNYYSMKEVIKEKPYAVIYFENTEKADDSILKNLDEILTTGFLHDRDTRYHFRHVTLLLSTTLASKRLAEISESNTNEDDDELDLMELIMREEKQAAHPATKDFSPQELISEIIDDLTAKLPHHLCQQLHLVPFLLLQKPAIQNIIHLKLRELGKMLESRYAVELSYAPEVVRFLANEITRQQMRDYQKMDIDNVLNQLYATIEQTVFSQLENKNRPNQLFLQLNETGQSLRCDWLATPRHHAS